MAGDIHKTKKIPFDDRLANTILEKIEIPAKDKELTEDKFYETVIARILKEDDSFMGINLFKNGFDVLEKIMEINAHNLMILELIQRMGFHQFSKIVDEPDEEHIILNYLYSLGRHEKRYENIDKAASAIWSAQWDRYENKHELIMKELDEEDKEKRDFTIKLLECISYNSSNVALDVIAKIFRNLQEIEVPGEVDRLGGILGSRKLTEEEIKNIEKHKKELLVQVCKTFRDVINSYSNDNEYEPDLWLQKSESMSALYKGLLQAAEKYEDGESSASVQMEGYLLDALYAIIKILVNIKPSIDDFDKSHIVPLTLDYIVKTNRREFKKQYLNNIDKIKDKIDFFYIRLLLEQIIENDNDQEIVHEAFNLYTAAACLQQNKEKIKTDISTQKSIIKTLKNFPNHAKDMEKHKRLKSVIGCMESLSDVVPVQYIFDYASQIVDVCKIEKIPIDIKTAACSFQLLEAVIENDRNGDIKNDDINNEKLKKLMESYLLFNQHDTQLFKSIIRRYQKLYGTDGLIKFLGIN